MAISEFLYFPIEEASPSPTEMAPKVQFFIISSKYEEIGHRINEDPRRGVTVINATGFYSGKEVKMLFVLAKKREGYETLIHFLFD